jgi:hypothetical protein
VRKLGFYFIVKLGGRLATKGPESACETKLFTLSANKVEYRQTVFIWMQSQATTELLQEYSEAFRRSQKQHGINFGNVDTFVVEIDNEDEVNSAIPQSLLR